MMRCSKARLRQRDRRHCNITTGEVAGGSPPRGLTAVREGRRMRKGPLMSAASPCRAVTVHALRGDRRPAFVRRVLQALDDEKDLRGPGPSRIECLLYAGHTGVS